MPDLVGGAVVKMGGVEYTVPPLNFRSVRKLQAAGDLDRFEKGISFGIQIRPEDLDALLRIVLEALKRNYPDMTIERLEELLDFGNALDVVRAILSISGIGDSKKTATGEAATGEAPAAA